MPKIAGARVLIVATDGFEEWELFGPREILSSSGAQVLLASPTSDPIQATGVRRETTPRAVPARSTARDSGSCLPPVVPTTATMVSLSSRFRQTQIDTGLECGPSHAGITILWAPLYGGIPRATR